VIINTPCHSDAPSGQIVILLSQCFSTCVQRHTGRESLSKSRR